MSPINGKVKMVEVGQNRSNLSVEGQETIMEYRPPDIWTRWKAYRYFAGAPQNRCGKRLNQQSLAKQGLTTRHRECFDDIIGA